MAANEARYFSKYTGKLRIHIVCKLPMVIIVSQVTRSIDQNRTRINVSGPLAIMGGRGGGAFIWLVIID